MVTCKECKFGDYGWKEGFRVCRRPINFNGDKLALDMKDEDYCSRGEKRE